MRRKYVIHTEYNHQEMVEFGEGRIKWTSAIGSSADGLGGRQTYHMLELTSRAGEKLSIFEEDVVFRAGDGELCLIHLSRYHDLTHGDRALHRKAFEHLQRGKIAGEKFGF